MKALDLVYLTGDATLLQGDGPKVIAHVCNDIGGWGQCFVVAISKRWQGPEAAFRKRAWNAPRSRKTSFTARPGSIGSTSGAIVT